MAYAAYTCYVHMLRSSVSQAAACPRGMLAAAHACGCMACFRGLLAWSQGPRDAAPQGPRDVAPQGPTDAAPQGPGDAAPQGPGGAATKLQTLQVKRFQQSHMGCLNNWTV